jgi:beta-galactosidase
MTRAAADLRAAAPLLGTQYYRPPFPAGPRWRDDLQAIAAAGLDAIEVWATWAWTEAEPGRYDFSDFDTLFDLAEEAGLDMVVTASADISPYWIHREIPDSHMVDHTGRRVESSTLAYTHHGVCPGGCTDHPEVRARMGRWLETLAARYAQRPNLRAWDCWNEMRWSVQSDGHVCFCPHTIAAFRDWLRARYGDLDGLNAAWRRRYVSWEDVQPGKQPARAWTETIAFQQFLAWRTAEHASFRRTALLRGDPGRPVLNHSVLLSPLYMSGESPFEQPMSRGNDWEMATRVDAFGVTCFPDWFQPLEEEYGMRVECARSAAAAADKPLWIAELQGGAAGNGLQPYPGVTAERQQRWIWGAYGRGAKAVVFWCWRDEVFGRESGGFGVAGNDGFAAERLAALGHTTTVLREHRSLLSGYAPDRARTAVLFEPLSHQLEWAYSGAGGTQATTSVSGSLLCLERLQVPYDVLAGSHLADLEQYAAIFAPWPQVVRPEVGDALVAWVRAGGTLVVESELGAFDEYGFFDYPDERALPQALGLRPGGRRPLAATDAEVPFAFDGIHGRLRTSTWMDPLEGQDAEPLAQASAGTAMLRRRVGEGTLIAIGTHASSAYARERYDDYERLVGHVVAQAGGGPGLRCSVPNGERVQWRTGRSGAAQLLFVTNSGESVEAVFTGALDGDVARDLLTGREARVEHDRGTATVRVRLDAGGAHVLVLAGDGDRP